ncbi:hypothetical protein SDRG_12699 [Saprolegnia diclina VS20]|uniref:Adenosinetriphosphatase n=1 Tax=Saprolegnia diclina (strain VS20) TaxID=1156394 RepID=T0PW07_SAPDV|nr:hypothetical protein SDRG_12699 [Saprolegnia diclina VS20]EQC29699.1 hypothetical protein SDRG_12699 [Saprolegnia diclina VS20]|eukprot:XP_008617003.1 hypothetical protein SDRG_12699 [Saprolegnia diclina VS20]
MAAIKEVMGGKVVTLTAKEIPVCGGGGTVCLLKDGTIRLRCRGKASLLINKVNASQLVLKTGNAAVLGIKDAFNANGSLQKYVVVDAPSSLEACTTVDLTKKRPAPAKVEPPAKVRRTVLEDSESSDSDRDVAPKKTTRRNTVIVDTDDEEAAPEDSTTEESSPKATLDEDGVESIDDDDDDDVYVIEVKAKPTVPETSWMAKYGRSTFTPGDTSGDSNGWITAPRKRKDATDQWTAKKLETFKKPVAKTRKPRKRVASSEEEEEEDEDDASGESDGLDETDHGRRPSTKQSQKDEVGAILKTCEALAETLRTSVSQWSSAPEAANDEETALVAVDDDKQFVRTADIPGLSPTLVLKPYQIVGVNWLYLLYQHKMSAVLADEMGLGKTVQTISFLALLCSKQSSPHFVIVPASTLSNWVREFARFAPKLRILTYYGDKEDRIAMQHARTEFDVLLTTYSYFERDACADDRSFFRKFHFGYVVLDEGHSIKNANTSRFKRIAAVRARHRLVLSGTPIQNNLSELLSLLSFLMPKIFNHGSEQMMDFFAGDQQSTTCAKIRRILAPFILRRMKKYVLTQMVPKAEQTSILTLPNEQRTIYDALVAAAVATKRAAKDKEAARKTKKTPTGVTREMRDLLNLDSNIFAGQSDTAIFTQLRKAANHSIMLRHHFRCDVKMKTLGAHLYKLGAFGDQCTRAMVDKEIESYSDFELHELCVQYGDISSELRALQLPADVILQSVKFDFLRSLLPTLQTDGHRVLIFSQWTKLLDLMEVLMEYLGYKFLRLDGSTSVSDRQALIDQFNEDTSIFVFLLSTRAGGLGINLTAADTVILHDLDFNPTIDAQACDRCHRIGQTKPVTIYKLVAGDTVDQAIHNIAEQKTQLNDAVLGELGKSKTTKSSKAGKNSSTADVQAILSSVLSSYTAQ